MLKLEKYLRKEKDTDIVAYLEISILVSGGDDKIVRLPLGPESKDITFKELGDFVFDYYIEKLKFEGSYGFDYKIDETLD